MCTAGSAEAVRCLRSGVEAVQCGMAVRSKVVAQNRCRTSVCAVVKGGSNVVQVKATL